MQLIASFVELFKARRMSPRAPFFFCGFHTAPMAPTASAQLTWTTFSCSTPTFFFGVSGPAQKAVLVPFF